MAFFSINLHMHWSILLLMATFCLTKDRDCDVPDSYHSGLSTSTQCEMELNDLADKLANISRCMILAARPLSACLSCYPLRMDLERAYTTIMGSGAGQPACAHELLDRDSTHMMLRGYAYYTDLLALGRCDLCLERTEDGSYRLQPAVIQFMETDAAFRRCMEEEFPPHKAENASAVVCDFCRPQYDMEQLHAKAVIQDTRDWRTCRDIIDMANTTQYIWQHHGCDVWELTLERFLYSLIPLAVGAVIVTSFYCYAWRRYLRLEREAAARAAAERATREPSAAAAPLMSQREHLYDYSGLRRRPTAPAPAPAPAEMDGSAESGSETDTSDTSGERENLK